MLKAAEKRRKGNTGEMEEKREKQREMRRKMLLFSPSLFAEMLGLWCSSSRSVKASLSFFFSEHQVLLL